MLLRSEMRLHLPLAAALCLTGTFASAQAPSLEEAPPVAPAKVPPPRHQADVRGADGDEDRGVDTNADVPRHLITGIGVSIEAGGGFGGFLDSRANRAATGEGMWTIRASFGTRRHLAYEAAYVGHAQTVNAPGLEHNAKLVGHGVETGVRYNVLLGMWQPYASAGIGLVHYSYGDSIVTGEGMSSSGNVVELPLTVGMAVRYSGLIVDTRFALHPGTGWGVVANANMSTWDLAARVGFEF